MVTISGHRLRCLAAAAVVLIGLAAGPAAAQSSISFTGGASIDPEQVYAGVAWESPDIAGRFHLRPGIEGGFGDGLRLGVISLDFVVKFPLGNSAWSLIQGGGPAVTITQFTGPFAHLPRDIGAGGSYLFGVEHANGFFTGFRVGGGGRVPQLKLGVGWSIEMR